MQNKPMNSSVKDTLRSTCPVACGLDLLGDKWTLIIIRDLFAGDKTYGELQQSPENIPTNLLSSRLKKLVAEGLIHKELYQEKPKRYRYQLTDKGRALGPVLLEMIKWALAHIPDTELTEDAKKTLKEAGVQL